MPPGSGNYERMEIHIITASGKSTKTHEKKSKSIFWRGRNKAQVFMLFWLGRTGCVQVGSKQMKKRIPHSSPSGHERHPCTRSHMREEERQIRRERELWKGMGGTFTANVVWLHLTRECEELPLL